MDKTQLEKIEENMTKDIYKETIQTVKLFLYLLNYVQW